MQCCTAVQCSAVQCRAVQSSAVQCSSVQHSAVQVQNRGARCDWGLLLSDRTYYHALHCTVLLCPFLFCTVLHCTNFYWTVLYCTVLPYTALFCSALYYMKYRTLYCTQYFLLYIQPKLLGTELHHLLAPIYLSCQTFLMFLRSHVFCFMFDICYISSGGFWGLSPVVGAGGFYMMSEV